MRALLDTHVLIWAGAARHLLSDAATRFLDTPGSEVLVSAASAWEIATKVRSGKLPEAVLLEGEFVAQARAAGFELCAITVEHGLRAGRFTAAHKDPFDRMIAAQALAEDIPVISADPKLDGFGVRRIW